MNFCRATGPLATVVGFVLLIATGSLAEVKVGWNGSTYIQDDEKGYKIKIGGRIMNDWVWNDADSSVESAIGGADDGVIFRRARLFSLRASGSVSTAERSEVSGFFNSWATSAANISIASMRL